MPSLEELKKAKRLKVSLNGETITMDKPMYDDEICFCCKDKGEKVFPTPTWLNEDTESDYYPICNKCLIESCDSIEILE